MQLDFLKAVQRGEITREDNPKRFSEMMIAIQKQIDNRLSRTVWLAINRPDILKDEVREIDDPNMERYRRFRAFAYVLSKLDPVTELEELKLSNILIKLSNLYPKYYFEIIKKESRKTNAKQP